MVKINMFLVGSLLVLLMSQCSLKKDKNHQKVEHLGQENSSGYDKPVGKDGYDLIAGLSDEFNGGSLDTNKWNTFYPYAEGRPPSIFYSKNVSVSDGFLKLRSTIANEDSVGNWIWSAVVTSKHRNSHYGYYEARVKASSISMTSSFWFRGPKSEIDVIELIGNPNKESESWREYNMGMNTHNFDSSGVWGGYNIPSPVDYRISTSVRDEFHVFGVDWDEDKIRYFLNDTLVAVIPNNWNRVPGPLYLIFDTEAFTWWGLPTMDQLRDTSRNAMLVDWVRAYRKVQ